MLWLQRVAAAAEAFAELTANCVQLVDGLVGTANDLWLFNPAAAELLEEEVKEEVKEDFSLRRRVGLDCPKWSQTLQVMACEFPRGLEAIVDWKVIEFEKRTNALLECLKDFDREFGKDCRLALEENEILVNKKRIRKGGGLGSKDADTRLARQTIDLCVAMLSALRLRFGFARSAARKFVKSRMDDEAFESFWRAADNLRKEEAKIGAERKLLEGSLEEIQKCAAGKLGA